MLSLPDFEEKQILFIQARKDTDNFLKFQNDNILYRRDEENIDMISCYKVFAVFVAGDFSITTVLIRNCEQYGIALFLLKNNFQIYASINSSMEGNYLLRERQYGFKEEFTSARKLIKNKIHNQLALLAERKMIANFNSEYSVFCDKIDNAVSEKALLGIEGAMSKEFFNQYFKDFCWLRRMPRTKYDINNVLLDIGYTFLFNFMEALLNLYGFDAYKGFYHKLFFQRKSLACDLIEPFRCLIDRQLRKAHKLGQIKEDDFDYIGNRYVLSYANQRKYIKIFFDCILERKIDLFSYVKDYYYFMMRNDREFPFYKYK